MMKLLQSVKNQDEEGLSLIEMVIAIVVFAIVALSAYPIFLRSVEMVSDNNLTTAASVTINKMLEDIRDTPNCTTLAKYSGAKDYKDNRNVSYTVSLSLKDKCEPGSVESFDIKAVKTSTSKSLLEQRVQVLVPPRNGVIELKK